jgi:uncharacterized protein (DUF305 family)
VRGLYAIAFLLIGSTALAQTDAPPGGMAPMAGMKPGTGQAFVPMNPAVQADDDAMKRMMADMGKPMTGNADQDFISHMIPHHQGAIDMAETELKYGSDPKLKQLAARIISAQQREIAFMQAWQAKHPMPAPPNVGNPHMQYK